jgi:hypothetical protein
VSRTPSFDRGTPILGAFSDDAISVEERIYALITAALLQGRLRPGAQRVERDLAAAFGCTRGALRKVAGGTELLGLVGQLVAKTELYKALFDPSKGSTCSADGAPADHRSARRQGPADGTDGDPRNLSEREERVVAQVRNRATGEDLGAAFAM